MSWIGRESRKATASQPLGHEEDRIRVILFQASPTHLLVVFEAGVVDDLLAHYRPQGVLELHELDKQVMLRIQLWQYHRALEIEREPLLDSAHACSLGEIQEERQVQDYGGGQDGVAGQEVYLYLHGIATPAEDVYVVPALLSVAAGRVVVDPDDVGDVLV